MQLYLVRHAHAKQNKEVDSSRWVLSDEGLVQAQSLVQEPFWENIDRIVVSSEPKTLLTIEPLLAKLDIPITEDARFDELQRGGWIDDYVEHVRQVFSTPGQSVGVWEPASDAQSRFLLGIETLVDMYCCQTVALIGHGLTFSIYRAYLLGYSKVSLADWQRLPFAAIARVDPVQRLLLDDFRTTNNR